MKHSQPPNPTVNPTSPGTTVWHYAILFYLAAQHLLHNDPRHVQYRDSRKAQQGTLNAGPSQLTIEEGDANPSLRRNMGRTGKTLHPSSTNPTSHRFTPSQPPSLPPFRNHGGLSKRQMSEAWTRMRSVSRLPVRPARTDAANSGKKPKGKAQRNVRWGSVQVKEYSQVEESAVDSGIVEEDDTAVDGGIVEEVKKDGVIWGAVPPAENEQEVWGAAANEHEVWGAVEPKED